MRKYVALSWPVVFMVVCILIGANNAHSLAISHEVFVGLLVGGIIYLIIVPVLLIFTARR
jgi:hypothetical protein